MSTYSGSRDSCQAAWWHRRQLGNGGRPCEHCCCSALHMHVWGCRLESVHSLSTNTHRIDCPQRVDRHSCRPCRGSLGVRSSRVLSLAPAYFELLPTWTHVPSCGPMQRTCCRRAFLGPGSSSCASCSVVIRASLAKRCMAIGGKSAGRPAPSPVPQHGVSWQPMSNDLQSTPILSTSQALSSSI